MAGNVAVDPWSAAFSAFGQVASVAAQPAGPSSAQQQSTFDSSGWTVNIGGGSASATATKTTTPTAAQVANSPLLLIGLGVLLYLAMNK